MWEGETFLVNQWNSDEIVVENYTQRVLSTVVSHIKGLGAALRYFHHFLCTWEISCKRLQQK